MVLGKNEFYQRDAQEIQLSDPPAVFRNPERNNGRGAQSSFSYMVDHPDEIRVFHFSADQKPSMILINEMSSVEGWLKMEDHLKAHSQFMMREHGARNAGGDPKAFLLDVAVLDGLTSDTFCLVLGTPCWLALSRLWRLGCAGHSPPM